MSTSSLRADYWAARERAVLAATRWVWAPTEAQADLLYGHMMSAEGEVQRLKGQLDRQGMTP